MSKSADRTVTRADLTEAVYRLEIGNRETGELLGREECGRLVEAVLKGVSDALVAGETVKLSSFGAFTVREKAERLGRNPKTGEDATITPRRVVTFRASNVMKAALNDDLRDDDDDADDEGSDTGREASPHAAA